VADVRTVSWVPGRCLRTRLAGAFLFVPLRARLRFDALVQRAGYPGSTMVPAPAALLSLLALKLLDKERRSHVNDFSFDEALGLFAGLNVLPKKSFLTEYSYRTRREQQRGLLAAWVGALSGHLFPQAHTFSLDFHPIPHRGEADGLERHYVPLAGKAQPSVLSFFALEQDSGVLCYANANLLRAEQPGEVLRFVEFWHELTGSDPTWLYFDSKVTTYPELSRLNQRGVCFVTIRRRGSAVVRRLRHLPTDAWQRAVIDTPKRWHRHIRYVDERVRLPGYEGMLRQVAVDGLGNEQPTLLLSNHLQETARNRVIRYVDERVRLPGYEGMLRQVAVDGLGNEQPTLLLSNHLQETAWNRVIRYAGRNRVEDGLGTAVNFFHLDCRASEVRRNVDLDAALTVLANGCYRWLGKQLKGFERVAAKQWYRRFIETGGVVEVPSDRVVVHLDRRSHNPILREAALDREAPAIPWWQDRHIHFVYS
jgi:hypothetical protein